jgi:formylglycine-generating enzyme required for sulfatase activity
LGLVRIKNISTGPVGGATAAPLVTIETVEVGDANNSSSTVNDSSLGAVSSDFRMATFEVTIAQYAAFLNTVAKRTDTTNGSIVESLYDSRMASDLNVAGISRSGQGTAGDPYVYTTIGDPQKPITYVTWFNAARFANWMHNGSNESADTETGAYTLSLATSGTFTKNPGATWWIPSENEWFKSAYYKAGGTDAGYWRYPTQSDDFPNNNDSSGSNQANFRRLSVYSITQSSTLDSSENYLTAVGTFTNCPSAYGTFDQGGNVDEWTDTVVSTSFGEARVTRGGGWNSGGLNNDVSPVSTALPGSRREKLGFRLARASVAPNPSSSLTGDFDVAIGPNSTTLKRANIGQIIQFSVRSGTFTVIAQDSAGPTARVSKEFSTGRNRTTFLTITNIGGQITISQAPTGATF